MLKRKRPQGEDTENKGKRREIAGLLKTQRGQNWKDYDYRWRDKL